MTKGLFLKTVGSQSSNHWSTNLLDDQDSYLGITEALRKLRKMGRWSSIHPCNSSGAWFTDPRPCSQSDRQEGDQSIIALTCKQPVHHHQLAYSQFERQSEEAWLSDKLVQLVIDTLVTDRSVQWLVDLLLVCRLATWLGVSESPPDELHWVICSAIIFLAFLTSCEFPWFLDKFPDLPAG